MAAEILSEVAAVYLRPLLENFSRPMMVSELIDGGMRSHVLED